MKRSSSRREFLKTASASAAVLTISASSYARVAGANDRISIGVIGCGQRGLGAHMPGVHKHAEAVIMAVRASDTGRRQIYDTKQRRIHEGQRSVNLVLAGAC